MIAEIILIMCLIIQINADKIDSDVGSQDEQIANCAVELTTIRDLTKLKRQAHTICSAKLTHLKQKVKLQAETRSRAFNEMHRCVVDTFNFLETSASKKYDSSELINCYGKLTRRRIDNNFIWYKWISCQYQCEEIQNYLDAEKRVIERMVKTREACNQRMHVDES